MKCTKCGAELAKSDLFCANCGAKVEGSFYGDEAANNQDSAGSNSLKNQVKAITSIIPNKKIGIVLGSVLAAIILLTAFLVLKKPVLGTNDIGEIVSEGYEGYGSAHFSTISKEEFLKKYGKKIKYSKDVPELMRISMGSPAEYFYENCIDQGTITVTPKDGLSNGDVVIVKWVVDDPTLSSLFKCKIKGNEVEAKVEGLKEIGTFNAFEDVRVVFKGYEGHGTASIVTGKYDFYYSLDKSEGLSNGDTVTVSFDEDTDYLIKMYGGVPNKKEKEFKVHGLDELTTFDPFESLDVQWSGLSSEGELSITRKDDLISMDELDFGADYPDGSEIDYYGLSNGDEIVVKADITCEQEYFAEMYGKLPSPMEKTYTVSGLTHYAEKSSEISEEAMKEMISQGESVFKSYVANDWSFAKLNSVVHVGNYFLKEKNGANTGINNRIIQIYKANATIDETNDTFDFYYPVWYENILVGENGTEVDLMNYGTPDDSEYSDEVFWRKDKDGNDHYYYAGATELSNLEKLYIDSRVDKYNFEKNISEGGEASEGTSDVEQEKSQQEEPTAEGSTEDSAEESAEESKEESE